MRSPSSRKCCHCREHFVPSPNNRRNQCYCSKALCRKASKAAAQAKWLNKAENRNYFRGRENVERVRQWRRRRPGYWRKKNDFGETSTSAVESLSRAAAPEVVALQDLAPSEVVGCEVVMVQEVAPSRGVEQVRGHSSAQQELALQDLASCQVPLLAGVVSLLIGDALQDRFADFARELVDRGKRVLAAEL
jgi:hypothetical protein